ncbi:MAG: Na-translocating system protein MpsB [Sulfurovum sp.]|nr:Na-translocating system protein MpsB [Sulfurovum sp.]
MSLLEKLNAVKDTVPHYWPIGAFIHHNPLKGFEHLNFKEGLDQGTKDIWWQSLYGSRVLYSPLP